MNDDLISRQAATEEIAQNVEHDREDTTTTDGKTITVKYTAPKCEIRKVVYVAQESINEIADAVAKRLPTAEPNHDGFLEFLFNVINPNEMEQYMAMYDSKGVAKDGRAD